MSPDRPDTWTDGPIEVRTLETWTDDGERRPAPRAEDRTGQFIGQYRVLDVLGEGGMGVVYRAEQRSPRRVVAVKVIRTQLATAGLRRRFEFEAQVLARLDHPGIARIYEAVMHGPSSWFAMEFVQGVPLDDFAEPLTIPERLELVARVADAVHHAHVNGVIHRDLKPANILVTEAGQPKILDFGIARAASDADGATAQHTKQGQVIGTPSYMSPEQASPDEVAIDARSDVYALGVIAYELLSGELPLELTGLSFMKMALRIGDEPPVRLSRHDPRLKGEIEAIVHKALEKHAADRYQSAAALAEDIRRHLRDEPILARPATTITQIRKFVRRNKLLSALMASYVGTATLGAVVLGALLLQVMGLYRTSLQQQQVLAERNDALVRQQARSELGNDPTRTVALLRTLPEQTDPEPLLGLLHEAELAGVATDLLVGHGNEVRWGAIAPDGRLATGSYDGIVRIWHPDDRTVEEHGGHGAPLKWVGFEPGTQRVFSVGADGTVRIDGERVARTAQALEVGAFGPDSRFAAGSDSGEIVRFQAGVETDRIEAGDAVQGMAWSADGDLAIAVDDGAVWLWPADGEARVVGRHRAGAIGVTWADGSLVSCGRDGAVIAWELESGEGSVLHTHPTEARALGWLDGDRLVSVDRGGLVRVWDRRTEQFTEWLGHDGVIRELAIGPGIFATGGADGLVRLWTGDGLTQALRGHERSVRHVAFSPDGSQLLSSSADGTARLWPVTLDGAEVSGSRATWLRVGWAVDGSLAWSDSSGGIAVTDADGLRYWRGHADEVDGLGWFRGGIATGSRDGWVRVWRRGELQAEWPWSERVDQIAVSPDGQRIAAAERSGQVPLFRLGEPEPELLHPAAERIETVAFDPRGELLAAGGDDGELSIWLTTSRPAELVATLEGFPHEITRIRWSPDGRTVAAVGGRGAAVAWTVDRAAMAARRDLGRPPPGLVQLEGAADAVLDLAWAADGERLATAARDGAIRVYRLDEAAPERVLRGASAATAIAWGDRLWSGAEDGSVRAWTLDDQPPTVFSGPGAPVVELALSPAGDRIAAAADGVRWTWPTTETEATRLGARLDGLTTAEVGVDRIEGTDVPSNGARDNLEAHWARR